MDPNPPPSPPPDGPTLEGSTPPLADEQLVRDALEQAFGYRGDVTIILKDGRVVEGYIFDRRVGPALADCAVRLLPAGGDEKIAIGYREIAHLHFSGRDAAAGRSFQTWVMKYHERNAAYAPPEPHGKMPSEA